MKNLSFKYLRHSRSLKFMLAAMTLAVPALLAPAMAAHKNGGPGVRPTATILACNTLVGIPRPFADSDPAVREENAIRGVAGGGFPWVVGNALAHLGADGTIDVAVHGLTIDPNDPAAQAAGLAGTNPIANFTAIVSCISLDEQGLPTIVNLQTDTFPADKHGNSLIVDTVDLPSPCITPIVFVTSPGGAWLAATGK